MSSFDEFLLTLDPRIAREVKTAQETHNEVLPLASRGLTDDLNGGIGKGRMTLLYGNTSAGKTALMMQSIGLWQKTGQVCIFVDVEGTWDNDWAEALGVDVSKVILIRERSVSKIYNKIRPLLEAGADALVLDSISMILSDSFIDDDGHGKDLEKQIQMGAQSKAIARLLNAMHYSNEQTAIVLISQTTTEIGQSYTKQVPTGGKKPMFASSQIIKLTSSNTEAKQITGKIHVGNKVLDVPVGRTVNSVVEKNKLGPQGGASSYDFYYRGAYVGVDHVGEAIDEAVRYGVISKGGAWFSKGDQKWQGRDSVVKFYRENVDELEALATEVKEFKDGSLRQDA